MSDFTISQSGGAGAGALNTELLDCRRNVTIQLAAEAAASYAWAVVAAPEGANRTIGSATLQNATWVPDTRGDYLLRLVTNLGGRILLVRVDRDASGDLLDYGITTPAEGRRAVHASDGVGTAIDLERLGNRLVDALDDVHEEIAAVSPITVRTLALDLDDAQSWVDVGEPIPLAAETTIHLAMSFQCTHPDHSIGAGETLQNIGASTVVDYVRLTVTRDDADTCTIAQLNEGTSWAGPVIELRIVDAGESGYQIEARHAVATVANSAVAAQITCTLWELNAPQAWSGEPDIAFLGLDVIAGAVDFDSVATALAAADDDVDFNEQDLTGVTGIYGSEVTIGETVAGEVYVKVTDTNVQIQSDGGVTIRELGNVEGTGASYLTHGIVREPRTTDDVANLLEISGGDAWASATTNVVGGALRLRGGKGKTDGTDLHGGVDVSGGRAIADNSTAPFRYLYAASGTDYFLTELFSLRRNTVSRCRIDSTGDTQWASSGFLNLQSNSANSEVSLTSSALALACFNGAVGLHSSSGNFNFHGPSSIRRLDILTPAEITAVSAANHVAATIAAAATYQQIGEAHVFADDPFASNWALWKLTFTVDKNATATWGHWTATLLDSGGAGSGWTCTNTATGASARINTATATGVVTTVTFTSLTRNN